MPWQTHKCPSKLDRIKNNIILFLNHHFVIFVFVIFSAVHGYSLFSQFCIIESTRTPVLIKIIPHLQETFSLSMLSHALSYFVNRFDQGFSNYFITDLIMNFLNIWSQISSRVFQLFDFRVDHKFSWYFITYLITDFLVIWLEILITGLLLYLIAYFSSFLFHLKEFLEFYNYYFCTRICRFT